MKVQFNDFVYVTDMATADSLSCSDTASILWRFDTVPDEVKKKGTIQKLETFGQGN